MSLMNILIVDDEMDVKQLFEQRFRRELKDNKLKLVFAFSGHEALQYLNLHPHEAVLILSDINMPGMSGLELLQEIKTSIKPPPKVIMITAYSDKSNYHQAKLLGADDFLTKPVDFTLLKQKLNLES